MDQRDGNVLPQHAAHRAGTRSANPVYENIATKFFEHFLSIAAAMNNLGGKGIGLWDEEDEFYYDVLHTPVDDTFGFACGH